MATNPLYNGNNSPNNSTQPTKSVNNQGVSVKRTHNTFDNSYFHFKTQKFGQYEPFFVCEGVPKDTITLHSSHNVRALPMATPFLSSLRLNKDYFMIPNQAIQPNTWEYIYKQPAQGDDVPFDAQNLFPLYANDEMSFFEKLISNLQYNLSRLRGDRDNEQFINNLVWCLMNAELFFSAGSLLSNLGFKLSPIFKDVNNVNKTLSFDSVFDYIMTNLSFIVEVDTDNVITSVTNDEDDLSEDNDMYLVDTYTIVSFLRRFGSKAKILKVAWSSGAFSIPEYVIQNLPSYNVNPEDDDLNYLRMDRINAYQLACSQYYVNPQVDFIYNAQLYRDNFFSLLAQISQEEDDIYNMPRFYINGISIPYDSFSLRNYLQLLKLFDLDGYSSRIYDLLSYLFGFRESLRFGDYFTDSRTRPLAPGSNGVPVVGNEVSVIDMSRSIIFQRFRNAVVKLSNNFEDYLRGIMGTSPSPDYHFPKFISHNDFVVAGKEVANTTSTKQGEYVTNLDTADDTYAFEVTVDMPCVILGLSYFSLPRVYSQTKERFFFHKDRFDFFNPILQYDIDQKVYNMERTDRRPNDEVFGYQSRYNEYKQRYSIASGAFVTVLPSWTFVTDSLFDPVIDVAISNTQSPDFIRASDYEFNRFLSRIEGVSMANGFHFIVVYNNKSPQVRPMEVNPNIL